NSLSITNKHYENTLEVALRDLRRDKTGQIQARIQDFADRQLTHWASLLSTLIINAPSTVCYDGQFYFDTDHSEGSSGTQSND
ncbi:Mu-like prophage major head subunit gpT family protein, partial [Lacticaseibacillus paracasei]